MFDTHFYFNDPVNWFKSWQRNKKTRLRSACCYCYEHLLPTRFTGTTKLKRWHHGTIGLTTFLDESFGNVSFMGCLACLQSVFSLRREWERAIRTVWESGYWASCMQVIKNKLAVWTRRVGARREKTDCGLYCNFQILRQPSNGVADWSIHS